MDLEQHRHIAETRIGKRARHARHRAFYQVGAGALDRGVDRGALAALPLVLARRLDAREPGFPPEQRFGIAALARALQRVADIVRNARKTLEIAGDQRLRLVGCYFEPAGETPARDAVEDREIDRRSEEHTSELQSLMRISYAVFCLKKNKNKS